MPDAAPMPPTTSVTVESAHAVLLALGFELASPRYRFYRYGKTGVEVVLDDDGRDSRAAVVVGDYPGCATIPDVRTVLRRLGVPGAAGRHSPGRHIVVEELDVLGAAIRRRLTAPPEPHEANG